MSSWIERYEERKRTHKCYCHGENGPDAECVSCEGTGYETEGTDEPICPWCGAEQSTDDLYNPGEYEAKCCQCGRPIVMELEHDPRWTTRRKKGA